LLIQQIRKGLGWKTMKKVQVVCYGLGAVGCLIAKFLLEKKGVQIVGAIDIAEDKVGKDLGELFELDRKLGIPVSNNIETVMSKANCDVIVHATDSHLKDVYEQIAPLAKYGANVVSTCEELAYPYVSEPALTKKLDTLATKHGVAFLGTGINPGFLMDTLVITLTGLCQRIERVKVERVINAATRRIPFQKKIGVGMSINEFKEKIAEKEITGHVGLEQSIGMIATALRWELDKIKVESVEPIIAGSDVESKSIKVKKGQVSGLKQTARGVLEGKEVVTLKFQAYIGAEDEYDSIAIDGVPPIYQKISPCVHGDLATVAVVVNSIPKILKASPGLLTMKDLPIPSAAVGDMRKYI
jgi:hypothetical protein